MRTIARVAKPWSTFATGFMVVVAAAALAACTPEERQPVVEDLTVEQAKAQSQEWEMRIAEHVRVEDVDSVEQAEFGYLRRCDTEGAYRWTGNTFVHLNRPLSGEEADAVTSALASSLEQAVPSEYTVLTSEATQRLAVEVFGPDGAFYTAWTRPVSKSDGVAVVNVTSASACFILPSDVYPGSSF